MDIIAIILTSAACVGGLFLLYGIIAAVMLTFAAKKAKKAMDDFDDDFFKNSPFRR
jgi:hypothetical protein